MKIKQGILFPAILALIGLYVFITALSWRWFEAKFLPLILSGLIIVLGLNQIRMEIGRKGKAKAEADEEDATTPAQKATARVQWRQFGIAMLWLTGVIVCLYLLGFTISAFLFAFAYIKTHGRTWLRSTFFALILIVCLYGIFVLGLKIDLYNGLLFSLLFD